MSQLDDQYNQVIENQRAYLMKLQQAFNEYCDKITAKTEEKLKNIPETDVEARKKILEEQKNELQTALSQLKAAINKTSRETRVKLEQIHGMREEQKLRELEQQILKS